MTRVVNNPNRDDLHPDDRQTRVDLRATLHRIWRDNGRPSREISIEHGFTMGALDSALYTSDWRYPTLQRAARMLGYRVQPYWQNDGVYAVPLRDATVRAMIGDNPEALEEVERGELRAAVMLLREQLGVERAELAYRVSSKPDKLRQFEESDDDIQFLTVTAMRYFRALGCPLRFDLVSLVDESVFRMPSPLRPVQRATAVPSQPRPAAEATATRLRVIDNGANVMLVVTGDDHKLTGLHVPLETWRTFLAEQALTSKP